MSDHEAIEAIVRIIRQHDGEAVDDLEHIAEIVAETDSGGARVEFGADA